MKMPIGKLMRAWTGGAILFGSLALATGVTGPVSAQNILTDGDFASGGTSTQQLATPNGTLHGVWNYSFTGSQDGCVVGSGGSSNCGFFNGFKTWSNPTVGTVTPYLAIQVEGNGSTNSLAHSITLQGSSTYTLTFNQAMANDTGATLTDPIQWTVNLGAGSGATFGAASGCTSRQCVTTLTPASGSVLSGQSSAWDLKTFTINTTSGGANVLTFIAGASNPGGPPVALLDSITLMRNSAPNPRRSFFSVSASPA